MKKISLALAALALCGAAQAGSTSAPFTVTVNFTSACTLTGTPVVAFGAYTAFAAAVSAPATTLAVACSRNTTITAIDYNTGSGNGLFTTANLQYVLTAPTIPTLAAGTAATLTSVGTADTGTITINGTLPSQAGNNNSGVAAVDTDNRTLTITF